MVTGVTSSIEDDGDIKLEWDDTDGPLPASFIIHYGNPNTTDPHDAIYMGYKEKVNGNTWTLHKADFPVGTKAGDKIPFYVQAYNEVGVGATNVDKARDLHDNHLGSEWSAVVNVITN